MEKDEDRKAEKLAARERQDLAEKKAAPLNVKEQDALAKPDAGRKGGGKRGTRASREMEELKKAMAEKEELANAYYAQLQRLQADFENYKKRTEAEMARIGSEAVADFIAGMLDTLDNFDRALASLDKLPEDDARGIRMVMESLRGYLEGHGLERLEAVGDRFDPRKHEAVMQETVEEGEDGAVLEEFQAGYSFRGRVLRPSRVKVARVAEPGDGQRNENEDKNENINQDK